MKHGQRKRRQDRRQLLLAWGIRFFLTAALTGNRILGGYAPFALGCVAAAGPGMGGAAAVFGAAAGALVLMDFADALPFLASCVLIFSAATAFQGSSFLARPQALSVTAAGLFLSVGLIYVLDAPSPADALAPCLASAALTGAGAWFFWPLLHPEEDRSPRESVWFLTAALLLAVQEIRVGEVSPGRLLLCALVCYTACSHGAAAGAAAGLGLGLASDLCGGGSGMLTAALGAGGLLCGAFHESRRILSALLFFGGCGAVLLACGEPLSDPLLVESAAGMGVFLLLPWRIFQPQRSRERGRERNGTDPVRDRLNRTAAALRELYDSCGLSGQEEGENPAVIFDRASERACRSCELCDLCWRREYAATYQALSSAVPALLDRGRAEARDFPASFIRQCAHLPEFLGAVNTEISVYLLRRQYRRQLQEARRDARGQYAQLSELLTAAAAAAEEAVPAMDVSACRLGAAVRPKRGESVCGDTVLSFQTDRGLWCLLLADGMGSGEGARRESSLTCHLLRQFLEAGIHPEAALQTLNSAMALRGEETGSFTTMDLCTFDTASGEASFYKFGAAPSYLKKGAVVRRITGISLPVGLRSGPASPDITHVRLDPGSFAVMISDGVADPGQDEWLQALLASWDGEEPQELAGAIMAESVRRQKARDDCGIQILYWPAGKRV